MAKSPISIVRNRIRHLLSNNFNKNVLHLPKTFSAVSFTFDDCPASAATVGAEILSTNEVKGTYFISFDMLGGNYETGLLASQKDVRYLYDNGHDIGCHTDCHLNAWETHISDYVKSIKKNKNLAKKIIDVDCLKTFSYPSGSATPHLKKFIQDNFICARGIWPGINRQKIDLNLLKAVPIYSRGDDESAKAKIHLIIQNVAVKGGWLIFYTHDVTKNPTPYGCTPKLLRWVLKECTSQRIPVLSIEQARGSFADASLPCHVPAIADNCTCL